MLIINDIHLGFDRQAGTTPAAKEALRSYLFTQFEEFFYLAKGDDKHICILGDLFDKFDVPLRDFLQTYLIMQDWLVRSAGKLTLVAGNHDHSAKAERVSSFQALCKVLTEQFSHGRVQVIHVDGRDWVEQPSATSAGTIALAHCTNQDIFNAKLAEVLELTRPGMKVLLHCNFDNNFAAVSDHSLNLTREQAYEFKDKGVTLYFAHEHQARKDMGGAVVVFGNQWPTSISDCLENDAKFAHRLTEAGVDPIQTWSLDSPEAGFKVVDWTALDDISTSATGFIRVEGTATSNQAGDVINAIAKFRSKSSAFVITNAVKIDGIAQREALAATFQATKAFDVFEFIKSNVTPDEFELIQELSKEKT